MPSWTRTEPVEAAFFDADGTLLSFATHQIPESTKQALHELKRAGVKCFLATGRPPYQVDMIDIEDMEAFILFNGQFVLNRYGVQLNRGRHHGPLPRKNIKTSAITLAGHT